MNKQRCYRVLVIALLVLGWATTASVGQAHEGKFIEVKVLRSDRQVYYVQTRQTTHVSCSIIGTGMSANMECNTTTTRPYGIPHDLYTALIIASDGNGYVISAGRGGLSFGPNLFSLPASLLPLK